MNIDYSYLKYLINLARVYVEYKLLKNYNRMETQVF